MIIEITANEVTFRLGNVKEYCYDSETKVLHVIISKHESYWVEEVESVKEV